MRHRTGPHWWGFRDLHLCWYFQKASAPLLEESEDVLDVGGEKDERHGNHGCFGTHHLDDVDVMRPGGADFSGSSKTRIYPIS